MKTKNKEQKSKKTKSRKEKTKLVREYGPGSPHYIDQTKGLGPPKYIVTKTDGTNVDQRAQYFVLRLDKFGHDPVWAKCCRKATRKLAKELLKAGHLPVLAKELKQLVKNQKRATQNGDST